MEEEIKSLDAALTNLVSLEKDLGTKFELRTLGTVVQGTICFLTIAANTLDEGQRRLKFTEKDDWTNLMSFINRAFYANLHTAIEAELLEFCSRKNIEVTLTQRRKLIESFEQTLKPKIPSSLSDEIESFIQKILPDRPSTIDVLNSALTGTQFTKEEKKYFRNLYEALSVLRNKSSHSDISLTDGDKLKLKNADLTFLVSPTGTLQSQPGHYFHLTKMVSLFLERLS
jgi:hypothetical protein